MYHNPVKVIETDDWRTALTKSISKLNINNPLIIASSGNIKRNGLLNIFDERINIMDTKDLLFRLTF